MSVRVSLHCGHNYFIENTFPAAAGTMIDSNGVELDTTNPFIARKLERIRAEKLVDHAFMKRVLSKSVTISEVNHEALFLVVIFVSYLFHFADANAR